MIEFSKDDGLAFVTDGNRAAMVVLHEIYGINEHIRSVCLTYANKGFDVYCPNLTGLGQPFGYDAQEKAYRHFIENVGFEPAALLVQELLARLRDKYDRVFVLGYSVGATVAWLCSAVDGLCDGVVGYYGSRIRDYTELQPKCPVLLFFPEEEPFDVRGLVAELLKKNGNVEAHVLSGRHGFEDRYSPDYLEVSSKAASKLLIVFLDVCNMR